MAQPIITLYDKLLKDDNTTPHPLLNLLIKQNLLTLFLFQLTGKYIATKNTGQNEQRLSFVHISNAKH